MALITISRIITPDGTASVIYNDVAETVSVRSRGLRVRFVPVVNGQRQTPEVFDRRDGEPTRQPDRFSDPAYPAPIANLPAYEVSSRKQ